MGSALLALCLPALAVAFAACSSTESAVDGDAGGTDAGTDATHATDAGSGDARTADATRDAGTGDVATPPDCGAPTYLGLNARGSDTPSFVNASTYDYSPSVMLDGNYRMWWCCGLGGDHVCHAEAASLDGPWHAHASQAPNSFDDTFGPTGNIADFDGTHTCDPSVVRVDGTYYMYYGGISENTPQPTWTRIGVATSADGLSWTRLNAGKAIVDAARDPYTANLPNKYGTGQPSIVFLDGLFYMLRTDTTGLGGNPGNGAGQYVLRSADPTFQTGVEELTATGFVAKGSKPFTGFSMLEAFAGDWQYVDALDEFVVADDSPDPNATVLKFFTKDLAPLAHDVSIPGHWTEEPALASRPDKHAVPWGGACGTLAMDVMRSVGPGGPATWDLAHIGIDLVTGLSCDCVPLARMLEGTLLAVPATPLTLVRGGGRLQFALGPPALRLARTQIDPGIDVFNRVPYAAAVFAANKALGATGKPGAYLLDDGKLWPVSCAGELTDNGSSITSVSAATYAGYAQGPGLFCLQ